jgi:hypothetical protein
MHLGLTRRQALLAGGVTGALRAAEGSLADRGLPARWRRVPEG